MTDVLFNDLRPLVCITDESDWDSNSTSSKRTLPEDRVASPQLPKCSPETFKKQGEDDIPSSPVTPQRSIVSNRSPQTVPFPQPSASMRVLHKQKCAEGKTGNSKHTKCAALLWHMPLVVGLCVNPQRK